MVFHSVTSEVFRAPEWGKRSESMSHQPGVYMSLRELFPVLLHIQIKDQNCLNHVQCESNLREYFQGSITMSKRILNF